MPVNRNKQIPDPSPADFELESFLPYRLSLLSNTVSEGVATTYREHCDIGVTEWRVIAMLGRFPGLTASEVGERTAMDKVSVSRAVKKLETKGLVAVNPHQRDGRRRLLNLTPNKGCALFNDIVPMVLDYERKLLSGLSQDELRRLGQLINKLQTTACALNDNTAEI